MKNIKVFFITLIGIGMLASLAFAQIPSPLKDVKVSASVILDSTTGIYTYKYMVFNPLINNGQICELQIDISRPEQSQELSAQGLVVEEGVYGGRMLTTSFEEEVSSKSLVMQKPIIPVGVKVPSNWSGAITVMGTVMWGGDEEHMVMPGQSFNGFMILTRGLPTIRGAELMPDIDYDKLPEEYYENVELTKQLQDSLTYHTKTIGPTAPPADFKSIDFISYIIDLKHQSASLGWITNKGVEQSLDAKLDNAKKKIEQGNTTAAKNILNAFINEVEAQGCVTHENCPSGKHLTPEAYALLKYNVQYLIGKL